MTLIFKHFKVPKGLEDRLEGSMRSLREKNMLGPHDTLDIAINHKCDKCNGGTAQAFFYSPPSDIKLEDGKGEFSLEGVLTYAIKLRGNGIRDRLKLEAWRFQSWLHSRIFSLEPISDLEVSMRDNRSLPEKVRAISAERSFFYSRSMREMDRATHARTMQLSMKFYNFVSYALGIRPQTGEQDEALRQRSNAELAVEYDKLGNQKSAKAIQLATEELEYFFRLFHPVIGHVAAGSRARREDKKIQLKVNKIMDVAYSLLADAYSLNAFKRYVHSCLPTNPLERAAGVSSADITSMYKFLDDVYLTAVLIESQEDKSPRNIKSMIDKIKSEGLDGIIRALIGNINRLIGVQDSNIVAADRMIGNIRSSNNAAYSLSTTYQLLRKHGPNSQLATMMRLMLANGDFSAYLANTPAANRVVEDMRELGFNTDIFTNRDDGIFAATSTAGENALVDWRVNYDRLMTNLKQMNYLFNRRLVNGDEELHKTVKYNVAWLVNLFLSARNLTPEHIQDYILSEPREFNQDETAQLTARIADAVQQEFQFNAAKALEVSTCYLREGGIGPSIFEQRFGVDKRTAFTLHRVCESEMLKEYHAPLREKLAVNVRDKFAKRWKHDENDHEILRDILAESTSEYVNKYWAGELLGVLIELSYDMLQKVRKDLHEKDFSQTPAYKATLESEAEKIKNKIAEMELVSAQIHGGGSATGGSLATYIWGRHPEDLTEAKNVLCCACLEGPKQDMTFKTIYNPTNIALLHYIEGIEGHVGFSLMKAGKATGERALLAIAPYEASLAIADPVKKEEDAEKHVLDAMVKAAYLANANKLLIDEIDVKVRDENGNFVKVKDGRVLHLGEPGYEEGQVIQLPYNEGKAGAPRKFMRFMKKIMGSDDSVSYGETEFETIPGDEELLHEQFGQNEWLFSIQNCNHVYDPARPYPNPEDPRNLSIPGENSETWHGAMTKDILDAECFRSMDKTVRTCYIVDVKKYVEKHIPKLVAAKPAA